MRDEGGKNSNEYSGGTRVVILGGILTSFAEMFTRNEKRHPALFLTVLSSYSHHPVIRHPTSPSAETTPDCTKSEGDGGVSAVEAERLRPLRWQQRS